jgi:hypothetical protein
MRRYKRTARTNTTRLLQQADYCDTTFTGLTHEHLRSSIQLVMLTHLWASEAIH